ncbi:copper resistance protein CopA [Psychromonas sp. psych-6C06]|uniref:copper resistance protein CopA n=1 Tax=Psychromonas sp. psych-6C06 TaxID=2058089 RepID=UPI00187C112E|nr:copper resistance protein CopA [Psychromonas sp. psych-6C06]
MNVKRTKIALLLSSTLFLSLPMSSAFAHEAHCEIKETQLGETMKHLKSELRAYVKGFKKGDQEKMQQHLNELLLLSEKAIQFTPVKIAQMDHEDMKGKGVPEMDHSKMNHGEMKSKAMPEMDHSKMDHGEMKGKAMPEMDHSKMDHGDMDSKKHDMTNMPNMEGMSATQHHQHMKYMQGMEKLQELFKALNLAKDEAEIKAILGKIKAHSKKSHQQFRQDC